MLMLTKCNHLDIGWILESGMDDGHDNDDDNNEVEPFQDCLLIAWLREMMTNATLYNQV